MSGPGREQVLAATLACIERGGLKGFSVEDAAREAGVSRATVYRWFPGGRDQLMSETLTWEVGRFFGRLAAEIDDAADFRSRVERGLAYAHRSLKGHRAFQRAMATDSSELLVRLADVAPLVIAVIRDYLTPLLAREELAPEVTPEEAADHLARVIASLIVDEGGWDLGDPDQVRDLVDRFLLGGILASGDRRHSAGGFP